MPSYKVECGKQSFSIWASDELEAGRKLDEIKTGLTSGNYKVTYTQDVEIKI